MTSKIIQTDNVPKITYPCLEKVSTKLGSFVVLSNSYSQSIVVQSDNIEFPIGKPFTDKDRIEKEVLPFYGKISLSN